MAGVNKVILIGNLGADPELRFTSAGQAVATLRLATNRGWVDPNTSEKKTATDWHQVVCWGKLGEVVHEHLGKGSEVYVEGRVQTKRYLNEKEEVRYSTEVVAETVQFL